MKFKIVLLISCLAISFSCSSNKEKTKSSKETLVTESIRNILDIKIPIWQEELNVPNVALGIIENGKITSINVYGKLKNGNTAPVNTLFNVASITKVVFTALVMKLIENGDWDLDEPLYRYHIDPDVKNDPRHKKLTTRHVLSQQSGFVNWRWNHPTEKLSFDFEPGTKFNYSGEGMEYLRQSIEKKFGKKLQHLADSILFKPLDMTDTQHSWDGQKDLERFSYWYNAQGELHDVDDFSTIDNAADDLITTVEDLAKFGIFVMNGAGVSNDLYTEMIAKQASIFPNLNQGLGWRVIDNLPKGEYAIQHGGNDIGVATFLLLLPKSKRGLVIFTNSDAGIVMCNNIVRATYKEGTEIIHRSYKSTPVDEIPEIVQVDPPLLNKYVGKYQQASGRIAAISTSKNSLIMKMPGLPNLKFLPESDSLFFLMDFDAKIEFKQTKNGKINFMNIVEGENVIKCKRLE